MTITNMMRIVAVGVVLLKITGISTLSWGATIIFALFLMFWNFVIVGGAMVITFVGIGLMFVVALAIDGYKAAKRKFKP